jgi:hypothetical protein
MMLREIIVVTQCDNTRINTTRLLHVIFPPSCSRSRTEAVGLPDMSLNFPRTFIGLVYSQFEILKIKLEKVNCNCLLFLGAYKFNVCYGPFQKKLPYRFDQATQLLLTKHHGLRTCIPGLEGSSAAGNTNSAGRWIC